MLKKDKRSRSKMGTVYAVGVGPGSQDYVTDIVRKIIQNSDVIAGYKYTLKTIEELLSDKEVYEITMHSQEEVYQKIKTELGNKTLVVPFTGDVNFSESEVVDRLIEIFGEVCVILVPRPWPKNPEKNFMPSEIAIYLKKNGFNTSKIKVHVFESLTNSNESAFVGMVNELDWGNA